MISECWNLNPLEIGKLWNVLLVRMLDKVSSWKNIVSVVFASQIFFVSGPQMSSAKSHSTRPAAQKSFRKYLLLLVVDLLLLSNLKTKILASWWELIAIMASILLFKERWSHKQPTLNQFQALNVLVEACKVCGPNSYVVLNR